MGSRPGRRKRVAKRKGPKISGPVRIAGELGKFVVMAEELAVEGRQILEAGA